MTEEKNDSICAGDASKNTMSELCDKANINFQDFIIHDGKNLHIDMNNMKQFDIKLKGIDSLPVGYREVTPSERIPLAVACTSYGHVISLNKEAYDFSRG